MTKHDCAVIMAYTGVVMLTGDDLKIFYEYITRLMGKPILSHEIPEYADEIKERAKSDFIDICKSAGYTAVNHGKWEHGKCTNCEKSLEDLFAGDFYYDVEELHFCPYCGARMDATDTNVGGKGGADNG